MATNPHLRILVHICLIVFNVMLITATTHGQSEVDDSLPMRRDQRRGVVVPDKTEDTEANGSIISSEVASLKEPLWLMPFIHQFRNSRTRHFQ